MSRKAATFTPAHLNTLAAEKKKKKERPRLSASIQLEAKCYTRLPRCLAACNHILYTVQTLSASCHFSGDMARVMV